MWHKCGGVAGHGSGGAGDGRAAGGAADGAAHALAHLTAPPRHAPRPRPQIRGDAVALYSKEGQDFGESDWQELDNVIYDELTEYFQQVPAWYHLRCRAVPYAEP